MANRLATAAQWLADQRTRHLAEEVTYQRGSASVAVSATRGSTDYQVDDGNGFPIAQRADDFLIRVSDLEIDGEPVTPANGDRIIVGEPEEGEVFEVMPIAGQQAWRYTDAWRYEFRIHTKRIGSQPPQP